MAEDYMHSCCQVVDWKTDETAIIVVDMWNVHWCHSATTRVGEIAVPMNATLAAARDAGIHIIYAPSDVTSFYASNPARARTLALRNATQPLRKPRYASPPSFPLGTATDGGCDAPATVGSPWSRQIETLTIDSSRDYIIAADLPGRPNAGAQELFNIVSTEKLQNLIYMGVVRYFYPTTFQRWTSFSQPCPAAGCAYVCVATR